MTTDDPADVIEARLTDLLGDVAVVETRGDVGSSVVTAVVHDTADVVAGCLYCCLPGRHRDGHDFAAAAVAGGARALLVERFVDVPVPQVLVAATRPAMAPVAAAFWRHPSARLPVVGVTGTNGKTTTTQLLAAALAGAGRRTGVIGTLSGPRTTPEAPALQARLSAFLHEGCDAAAVEVSSEALAQHRVDATRFRVAVFTNLGPEHLNFHGTMEAYFRAKARLFEPDLADLGYVNADDEWGRRLLGEAGIEVRPYSVERDVSDLTATVSGSEFTWRGERVRLPLGGRFNVANALAAALAAAELGATPAQVAAGLATAAPVAGRFEPVAAGQGFAVVVDYAHTPDALAAVLRAARPDPPGRLVVVFGCGGDRDRGKRPLMGRVASELADLTVVTSDNPRSEDPLAIIEEIRAGLHPDATVVIEPDRREAIALALRSARDGDAVVVAGKGHETGQVVGDEVLPFDDRTVTRELLERELA